jgi:anti-sigma factor RsiW
LAAGLLIFAAGAMVGFGLPLVAQRSNEIAESAAADGWREIVAEYLTLYTSETLADIPEDAAQRARELSTVADKLTLDISPDKVALPGLAFKRAQLFALDGQPLAQIAYLSSYGPVAFCVIRDDQPDAGREFEERHGQSIVYWSKGGHAFMLIGKVPRSQLETLAATLEQQVS